MTSASFKVHIAVVGVALGLLAGNVAYGFTSGPLVPVPTPPGNDVASRGPLVPVPTPPGNNVASGTKAV